MPGSCRLRSCLVSWRLRAGDFDRSRSECAMRGRVHLRPLRPPNANLRAQLTPSGRGRRPPIDAESTWASSDDRTPDERRRAMTSAQRLKRTTAPQHAHRPQWPRGIRWPQRRRRNRKPTRRGHEPAGVRSARCRESARNGRGRHPTAGLNVPESHAQRNDPCPNRRSRDLCLLCRLAKGASELPIRHLAWRARAQASGRRVFQQCAPYRFRRQRADR